MYLLTLCNCSMPQWHLKISAATVNISSVSVSVRLITYLIQLEVFPGFEYLSRLIWRMYRNADSVDSASVCRAVKFEGTCRYFNLFLLPSLVGLGLVAAPKVWAGGRYPHMTLPSSPAQPSPAQPSPAQPSKQPSWAGFHTFTRQQAAVCWCWWCPGWARVYYLLSIIYYLVSSI